MNKPDQIAALPLGVGRRSTLNRQAEMGSGIRSAINLGRDRCRSRSRRFIRALARFGVSDNFQARVRRLHPSTAIRGTRKKNTELKYDAGRDRECFRDSGLRSFKQQQPQVAETREPPPRGLVTSPPVVVLVIIGRAMRVLLASGCSFSCRSRPRLPCRAVHRGLGGTQRLQIDFVISGATAVVLNFPLALEAVKRCSGSGDGPPSRSSG